MIVEDVNLEELVGTLKSKGLTVGFVESCTGGRLSADLTTVAGSSAVVKGSLVCYQIAAKQSVLGLLDVDEGNVVSEKTALGMAAAGSRKLGADITVSTTGYLDPDQPDGARAHWALVASVFDGDPRNGRLNFPRSNTRAENRELLIRQVFQQVHEIARNIR